MVGGIGHAQGQHMVKTQPMKMAAAEALWDTEQPASFSLVSLTDEANRKNLFALPHPVRVEHSCVQSAGLHG